MGLLLREAFATSEGRLFLVAQHSGIRNEQRAHVLSDIPVTGEADGIHLENEVTRHIVRLSLSAASFVAILGVASRWPHASQLRQICELSRQAAVVARIVSATDGRDSSFNTRGRNMRWPQLQ